MQLRFNDTQKVVAVVDASIVNSDVIDCLCNASTSDCADSLNLKSGEAMREQGPQGTTAGLSPG